MKTVQMTLDEELIATVDKVVKSLRTTRSAFTREALKTAIDNHYRHKLEKKHQNGYQAHPVARDEFSAWEEEQDWGKL